MTERYRLVRTPAGTCWFVVGERGLLRSALPLPTRREAREHQQREFPDAKEDKQLLP